MPELIVSKNEKTLFRVPLSTQTLTIGRSQQNDLVLPDDDISRRHAEIIWNNGSFLNDLKSTGGVFVGGKKVESVKLSNGDEINIGSWKIIFNEMALSDKERENSVTTCIARIESQSSSNTRILKLSPLTSSMTVMEWELELQEPQAPARRFKISKNKTVLGSHPECDIVLRDDYISGKHCQFEKKGEALVVVDLHSTNGTLMNGQKIQEATVESGGKIKVGETIVTLVGKSTEEKITPIREDRFCGLVGKSEAMQTLFGKIERVAPVDCTVLVQGETGCGKELVARALHDLSSRRKGPYVVLNCGAISPNLIESELFGHEKGAYTGAAGRRLGAFEEANGGTLFLDEIGELPLDLQPKILRALENRTIKKIGSNIEESVNVRVIAATHRNLMDEVKKGKFREDLYYRLYVVPLIIPALRDRTEDIPLLANYFLKQLSSNTPKTLSPEAIKKLQDYSWPGNVREIKNVLMRSLVFANGSILQGADIELMEIDKSPAEAISVSSGSLDLIEKEKILQTLKEVGGNKTKAAQVLGIAKSTLFKKLRDYGLMDGGE